MRLCRRRDLRRRHNRREQEAPQRHEEGGLALATRGLPQNAGVLVHGEVLARQAHRRLPLPLPPPPPLLSKLLDDAVLRLGRRRRHRLDGRHGDSVVVQQKVRKVRDAQGDLPQHLLVGPVVLLVEAATMAGSPSTFALKVCTALHSREPPAPSASLYCSALSRSLTMSMFLRRRSCPRRRCRCRRCVIIRHHHRGN